MTRNDLAEILQMLQTASTPLVSKLQAIDEKVNVLSQDRVTRSDIEKLRAELVGSMVPRDSYEPRHLALTERQTTLEGSVREVRKEHADDMKALREAVEQDLERIHERLESGKQQLEDRMKQQTEAQLSTKDRNWVRVSQWAGILAIILSVLDWIFQHVKVQ